MFSKLHIPDAVDDALIRRLKLYVDTVKSVRRSFAISFPLFGCSDYGMSDVQHRPLKDATSRNSLTKFDALISKKFEKQLELKEEELRKSEELQDLFEFLDDIIPEDDGEIVDLEPKRRGRKRYVIYPAPVVVFNRWGADTNSCECRRSTSVTSTVTDDETPSHESRRGKPKAKK
jgi:condensin complex subunit 3